MFSKTTKVDDPELSVQLEQAEREQRNRENVYLETDQELNISGNTGTIAR